MRFFSKTIYEVEPSALGIDITDSNLRAVLLRLSNQNSIRVEAYAEQPIKAGLIEDGLIRNEERLLPIFHDLRKQTKLGIFDTRFIVSGISEQNAFLQVFSVPKMKQEELSQAIKWELEGNIPLALNEVYFDWEEIQPFGGPVDHSDILVAAAPRGVVDSYVHLLESANFTPRALEVESAAIARALIPKNFSPKPILIIDLGASRTNFIIFSGSAIRFTSSLPISGRQMTQAIAQAMSISFDDAEKIKWENGLNKNTKFNKGVSALLLVLDDLIAQVQKYLNYYKSHSFHEHNVSHSISKILLSGGGANLKGMTQYLGSKLKFDVEVGNPWSNILEKPFREIPSLSFEQSLSFTAAIGFALRGLPREKTL